MGNTTVFIFPFLLGLFLFLVWEWFKDSSQERIWFFLFQIACYWQSCSVKNQCLFISFYVKVFWTLSLVLHKIVVSKDILTFHQGHLLFFISVILVKNNSEYLFVSSLRQSLHLIAFFFRWHRYRCIIICWLFAGLAPSSTISFLSKII